MSKLLTAAVSILVVGLAALGVACSASAGGLPVIASSAPLVPTSDPFYSYSGSLKGVAPGSVLTTRTVTLAESGKAAPITATQLLYRTSGELGQPTVTVATIVRPTVSVGTTKIVSYQTAYDALGSQCDPSYTLQGGNSSYSTAQEEEQLILTYSGLGYTVVVPDYEGERLDWGAGQESGYGTLDAIRATENLLRLTPASTPVGMIGYSGGSIATEFASELAPTYAPHLDIVGVAEGGVPVDFLHNLSYINGSPDWSGVIPAVLVSTARAFGVGFEQYLSPYGVQVTNQVKNECINSFVGDYPGLTYQKLLKPKYQDIYKIPSFVRLADRLIMSRIGTPKGPLFIGVGNADGTGDGVMVAKDVEALAHTYCQRGVSVQFNEYSGDDHDAAAVPFEEGAFAFLTERLAGQSVKNGCSSIGVGNSLAPLPVPPSVGFRNLGRRRQLGGVLIKLWSTTGTLNGVAIALRRRGRLIEQLRLPKLTTRKRRLVLRQNGSMPRPGRYTVMITQRGTTLLVRKLKIA
jgi:Secretory lipase